MIKEDDGLDRKMWENSIKIKKIIYVGITECQMLTMASKQKKAECGILTYYEKNARYPVRFLPDVDYCYQ
jgi:hypothetical protein